MPERQCGGCKRQKEWGCTAKRWRTPLPDEADGPENWINPSHIQNEFDGEMLFSCPRQTLHEQPTDWSRLLLFYGMFGKGHLPDKGAVVDQSNVLVQAFRILDEANADCDKEEADRATRRRNREAARSKRR